METTKKTSSKKKTEEEKKKPKTTTKNSTKEIKEEKKETKKSTKKKKVKLKINYKRILPVLGILLILIVFIVIKMLSGNTLKDVSLEKNNSVLYSFRLLDRVEKEENVVISDLTLNPTLTLFYQYGNDKVKEELSPYFGQTPEEMVKNFDTIHKRYKNAYKKVNFENSIWINKKGEGISKEVKDSSSKELHFTMKDKEFNQSTVKAMNRWVKKKSHGKVEGDFTLQQIEKANSILMGTLYFHEKWNTKYEKEDIIDGTFSGLKGKQEVTYLNSEEHIYLENNQAKGFMKPYKDTDLYFVGVIPVSGNSLDNINLVELMKSSLNTDVDVRIPEFTYRYNTDLTKSLKDLGIKSIFEPGNLDKIGKDLYVSSIYQKNYIKVNREGTEAFSLNVTQLYSTSIDMDKKQVYLDHPFIFMIYDKKLDQVLFIGKVNNIEN